MHLSENFVSLKVLEYREMSVFLGFLDFEVRKYPKSVATFIPIQSLFLLVKCYNKFVKFFQLIIKAITKEKFNKSKVEKICEL